MRRLCLLLIITSCLYSAHAQCPIKEKIPACTCQTPSVIMCENAKFTQLPDPALVPSTVTTLVLEGNMLGNLTSVPYPQLTLLNLAKSNITTITYGAFSNLTQLKELDLSHNKLTNIERSMFLGLGSLEKMILNTNHLPSITPHALCPGLMPNVYHLNLEYNQITVIPEATIMYPKLAYLNLGYNKLSKVPSVVWAKSPDITELFLEGNEQLNSIGAGAFQGLKKVWRLNADTCGLVSIDDQAFTGVPTITHLYLGNNKLKTFSVAVTKPFVNTLQELHLQNNNLNYVDYEAAKNVKSLNVDNNMWHCDCKVKWLAGRTTANNTRLLCSAPPEKRGWTIANATMSMDCPCVGDGCKSNRGVIALAIGIPILLVCAGLIAFFLWRIAKARKEDQRKSVRYSAVYKDTVEQKQALKA